MCGICGIVGPSTSHPTSRSVVRDMMDILHHRGPDDEGLIVGENFVFGHKRLAIIDLEYGAQPMQSDDELITLIYNGEIYNYLELRQELIRKGVRFKTFSDTEVLLRLYENEGPGCVERLNGMFAFAIFDSRNNLFFAARDHFGIKPLYYSFLQDEGLIFASEIKALLQHPEIKAELDYQSLHQYLTFQFCLNNDTLFKNINKLEPAQYLLWSLGKKAPEFKKYWGLDYQIDTYHTEEYFLDNLLLLLEESVHLQLRSDVPLGVHLSGGIDSSSVTCLAASKYGSGFKCFTGKFAEGPEYDESHYARSVTEAKQCEYYEVIPSAQDFIELIPKLIYYMDEPAAGPGLFPQYMVSRLAKENVTVVLGGQGGDEIFGGYARYLVAYLEQCLKGAIFETQEEGRHIVTLDSIIPNLPLIQQYVPMLKAFWSKGLFEPMDQRYFRLVDRAHDLKQILNPEIWSKAEHVAVFEQFRTIFNAPSTKSYINKMLYFDQRTLLPALLQVEDRMSMAVSLESRVPLLDYRIAELLAKMPPPIKFRGGQTKYALRRIMRSFLPTPVLERKDKMGFPVPLKEWWGGSVKEFVEDILLGQTSRERGIFQKPGLEIVLRKEGQYGRQIWGALCLELWHRTFIDKQ